MKAAERKIENSPAAAAEAVRIRRLREDAARPMSENLAEAIALSHAYLRIAGAAKPR